MVPYQVHGTEENRVLEVVANASQRFQFYVKNKGKREEVKFQRSGGSILAVVKGAVLVYKKPHAMAFHKEYMAHNARALWLGLESRPDMLLENMLEYVETI